jgi:hypothetical protein
MLRVQDVIDNYAPDILTFDDGAKFNFDDGGEGAPDLKVWLGIPDLAPEIIAYFYNKNILAHSGNLEGVVDLKEVVGAEGFEPPTLCSQSRCATRLRYAPTSDSMLQSVYTAAIVQRQNA